MESTEIVVRSPPTHVRGLALRNLRLRKPASLLATLSVGLSSIGSAHALGLSEISQQSGLGEPLRLVIPVIVNDQLSGDDLTGECFKVVPATANDVPQLNSARLTLERRGPQAFVILTTPYSIEEPIMRFAVQAGCRVQISREYTVFFDPVSIEPPAVQVAAATGAEPQRAGRADDADAEMQAEKPAAAPIVAPPAARPTQRAAAPAKRSVSPPRPKAPTVTRATSLRVTAPVSPIAAPSPPAAKSSTSPRLQISRTVGDAASAPAATTPKSVADRDALMALEEQTVVLQRRIAELSTQMERIDAELRAAQAARAAAAKKAALAATERAAAEQSAVTKPSTWRFWLSDNWPLLVLVPVLIALIAALLTRRRGQRPLVPRPFTATQAASYNAADLGEPSVPKPEAERDREAVVASIKDRPRGHVIPPVFVEPIEPDQPDKAAAATRYEYDPGINVDDINFDEEVRKAHEAAAEYSVLEREEPGIVVRLVDGWGTQRTTAQLENILLTPRRSGKPLSTGAIEELKLLRSIAMERVADLDSTMQQWIGNPRTPPGSVAGTH